MFLWQLLSDESCDAAVATAIAYCHEVGVKAPDVDTGGYVRARNKIPAKVYADLAGHLARELEARSPSEWKPFGRPTWTIDGTTFTLPATPENLEKFQCHPNQHPDVGLPIPRAIAAMSMTTGCLLTFQYDNYSGKGTGEISMLRNNLNVFQEDDLVVMDALYCSFPTIALLKRRGVDTIVRMSGSRLVDHRSSERLGTGDFIMTWKRPAASQIPHGYSVDDFPETLRVRVVRYRVKNAADKWETFEIVTTLLDETKFPRDEIARLYDCRWYGETDIRTLKGALSLDHVRCLTPENVEREVWGTILGYNLVRKTAASAANATEKRPRDIGFTGTWNIVSASWQFRSVDGRVSKELLKRIWESISKHRVGHRPGRLEPRVVRKRPKPHPKMKMARSQYHRRVSATEITPEFF
ncbi:MAG: IS4 family transposase [Planctomycetaceae bacterium]|nr:IS4 family transposase [Planctomycetaceae bacterium]